MLCIVAAVFNRVKFKYSFAPTWNILQSAGHKNYIPNASRIRST